MEVVGAEQVVRAGRRTPATTAPPATPRHTRPAPRPPAAPWPAADSTPAPPRAAAAGSAGSRPDRDTCRRPRPPPPPAAAPAAVPSSRADSRTDSRSVTSFAPMMTSATVGASASARVDLGGQIAGGRAADGVRGEQHRPARLLGQAAGQQHAGQLAQAGRRPAPRLTSRRSPRTAARPDPSPNGRGPLPSGRYTPSAFSGGATGRPITVPRPFGLLGQQPVRRSGQPADRPRPAQPAVRKPRNPTMSTTSPGTPSLSLDNRGTGPFRSPTAVTS